jgi:hypothetical protein
MKFLGELAIGFFDVSRARRAGDAENVVRITHKASIAHLSARPKRRERE